MTCKAANFSFSASSGQGGFGAYRKAVAFDPSSQGLEQKLGDECIALQPAEYCSPRFERGCLGLRGASGGSRALDSPDSLLWPCKLHSADTDLAHKEKEEGNMVPSSATHKD